MNELRDSLNWVGRTMRTLLAILAVAFVVSLVGAVVLSSAAHAAVIVSCLPITKQTPSIVDGSKLRTARSDTGRWFAWWCGRPDPADATRWLWRMQTYAVLKEYSTQLEAAIATANDDVESYGVLNVLITMPSIVPAPGSQEDYRWRMLRWSACQALSIKPYDIALSTDLPPNFCGAAPTPPVVTNDWTATGATIFTYSAGRLTGVTSRKAVKGAACDDRSIAIVGATVYRSLAAGPSTEVTPCTKP